MTHDRVMCAIISALHVQTLRALVEADDSYKGSRRSRKPMEAALLQRYEKPEDLLRDLTRVEMQNLCDVLGITRRGSTETLSKRLSDFVNSNENRNQILRLLAQKSSDADPHQEIGAKVESDLSSNTDRDPPNVEHISPRNPDVINKEGASESNAQAIAIKGNYGYGVFKLVLLAIAAITIVWIFLDSALLVPYKRLISDFFDILLESGQLLLTSVRQFANVSSSHIAAILIILPAFYLLYVLFEQWLDREILKKCPVCKKEGVLEKIRSRITNRRRQHRRITDYRANRGMGARVNAHYTTEYWQTDYRCQLCGNTFSRNHRHSYRS